VKEETKPKISLHLWYTDKADKAAAFYASKVAPGKHIGRLNVRARIDHRDRKPPNRGLRRVPCYGFQL
jgi:predicted 3-demethylubiquinone-9 3-methyltransferase (glyoxalase superfamily)